MTRARATALFGLALVAAAFYVRPSTEIQSDERAAAVYAVVDRGSLVLDPYVRQVPDVAYDLAERGGHYYLAKPPLPSALLVPVYAALRTVLPPADLLSWDVRWLLTLAVAGLPFALLLVLVPRVLADLGFPRDRALAVAIAIGFGSPLLLYATYLYSHVLAALLLLALFALTLRAPRHGFYAGLLAGLVASSELLAAVAAAVLVAYHALATLRARGLRACAPIVAGGVLGAAPLLAYQAVVFGSPFAHVYSSLAGPELRAALAPGPFGAPRPDVALSLLFSGERGLFVFAPATLAAVLALPRVWRRDALARRALLVAYVASATQFLVLTAYAIWDGGATYGPRLLLSIVPLLAWPAAALSARALAIVAIGAAAPHLVLLGAREPLLPLGYAFAFAELARRPLQPSLGSLALGALGLAPHLATLLASVAFATAVLACLGLLLRAAATVRASGSAWGSG